MVEKINKLNGTRTYLVGGMEMCKDNGVGWRDMITPKLQQLGVVVLNPCKKPVDGHVESLDSKAIFAKKKQENRNIF